MTMNGAEEVAKQDVKDVEKQIKRNLIEEEQNAIAKLDTPRNRTEKDS